MIQEIDEILRRLLSGELAKIAGCPLSDASRVTFDAPAAEMTGKDAPLGVNLYLYDVQENLTLRNSGLEMVPPTEPGSHIGMKEKGRRRASLWLDMSYVVTISGGENAAQHRLLADVMRVLLRADPVPKEYLGEGQASAAGLRLAVAQPEHPVHADAPAVWQALEGRMRPAVGLTVTVPFNPFETKWTRVVREAVMALGPGLPPLGPGLPPLGPGRPLDIASVRVSAAGVVLDQVRDEPLPSVRVRALEHEQSAVTDEQGFFSLLSLPPGPCTLRFERAGYKTQERAVTVPPFGRPDQLELLEVALPALTGPERAEAVGQAEAEKRLAGSLVDAGRSLTLSLAGRILLDGGSPAAFVPVRVGNRCTTTDADGVYCFFGLPPGEHTVYADLPGVGERVVPAAADVSKETTKDISRRKT